MSPPPSVQIIESTGQAAALLSPLRLELLEGLRQPGSAASLARQVGLPRQKVNYHLKALQEAGLVDPVEERRKGNCVEVLMQARAESFVVAPSALGGIGAQPDQIQDRFSWGYLVAVCAGAIRDLARLRRSADTENKGLATLTLEAEVTFRSAAQRSAFANDLANAVAGLVDQYHSPSAPGGRSFRLLAAAYPVPATNDKE